VYKKRRRNPGWKSDVKIEKKHFSDKIGGEFGRSATIKRRSSYA